jgi:hypothetical protein
MGSTATDTWNTSHGTSSTPGFSAGLVTCELVDSVGLTAVLAHVGVDKVDNVRPDGGYEDRRELDVGSAHLILVGVDRDQGTGGSNSLANDSDENTKS